MDFLLNYIIRNMRPRVGWAWTLLGLAAVLCLPAAATGSNLNLPVSAFFWAGLIGFLIGLRSTPQITLSQTTPNTSTSPVARTKHRAVVFRRIKTTLWICIIAIAGSAFFALSVGSALPPLALVIQDIGGLVDWCVQALRGTTSSIPAPTVRSWTFLSEALPRFQNDLLHAPQGGQQGAQLLVGTGGVVLTWVGSLILGRALLGGRTLLAWELPLFVALLLTSIFAGGRLGPLILGSAILLLLVILGELRWREKVWSTIGADFSTELRYDILSWGGGIVIGILLLSIVLPVWFNNPLASLLWRNVNAPSGLAVLERNAELGGNRANSNVPRNISKPPATVPINISKLPALNLGLSLEQGSAEQVALRIRLDKPLPTSSWLHYWRARLFNVYTGGEWTTNARVSKQDALPTPENVLPNTIVQTIEDMRADREILIALPNVIGVNVPANFESFSDGALAALTTDQPIARYTVLSIPEEYATPPSPEGQQPDLSPYQEVPKSTPPRVGELTRAIVGSEKIPYKQALALEAYLRELPYSYAVQPLPSQGDAVAQFLFDMRQGYCTYYASAMAIMAREIGIPSRIAVGYATGKYDAATNIYTLYENDAHAWPELYINGVWVPFEPTPIRPLPARTSELPTPVLPQVTPVPRSGPLIWLLVLIVVIGLSALGVWLGRRNGGGWQRAHLPLATQIQQQLERLGSHLGVAWPEGATLHEYGLLLIPRLSGVEDALAALVALIEQARYSGQSLNSDEERRLSEAWRRVQERSSH